jgi:pyridoxine/pyridoxamine 5'-phosphate oxidase
MDQLPDWVKTCLASWFSYPGGELFCQVSTVGQGIPHIRTMLLYDITQTGHFVFLSRVNTQKWQDLIKNPSVALHALSLEKGQIIIQGTATLKTVHNDPPFCQAYWHKMMPEAQKIYRQDSLHLADYSIIPESFGGFIVVPSFFDVLELKSNDYTKSCRLQFRLKNGKWLSSSAQAV